MNPSNHRVRRATVDDLGALSALLQSMNLKTEDLIRRITEFQIAENAEGKLLGAIAIRLDGRQGLIHGEGFTDFGYADQVRPLFWERIRAIAVNHGLTRLWTQEVAPFWSHSGLQSANEEALKRLPETWVTPAANWLTLQLKDEEAVMSLEKEIALMMQTEKEKTAKIFSHAKTMKMIATAIALLLAVLVAVALFYMFKKNPGILQRR